MSAILDPDDVIAVRVYYSAPPFEANVVYREGMVVAPTVDNGYYYVCTVNGKAGSTEPTWTQSKVTSGTAVFTATPYDLWVLPTETLTASEWTATIAGVLSQQQHDDQVASVWVGPLPSGTTEVSLTNSVTKSTGEKINRTLKFKVGEQ
jgi:hypothetical protein